MFEKLAATITKNAPCYRTIRGCELMGRRLKWAYNRAGAYGVDYSKYRNALWEIQLRAAELRGQEYDAKFAASLAAIDGVIARAEA